MATTSTTSNRFLYELALGNINFSSDIFRIILMNTTYTFDRDNDDTLADVTSDQLSNLYGYTQDAKTLQNIVIVRSDANDNTTINWDNPAWTAYGGTIGPSGAAIIYDASHADEIIIGCIDFGTDISIPDSESKQIVGIIFEIS